MYGEKTEGEDRDVFYYLTVYNEPKVQPPAPELDDLDEQVLRGLYRFAPRAAGVGERRRAACAADRQRHRDPLGARRAGDAGRRLGRQRRRLECDVVDRAATRGTRVRQAEPAGGRGRHRRRAPHPVDHPSARRRTRPGDRGQRLDARRARPDRPVGARRLVVARHRRLRTVRHPRGAATFLRRRRGVDRARDLDRAGPPRRGQSRGTGPRDREVRPAASTDGADRRVFPLTACLHCSAAFAAEDAPRAEEMP